ncbi:MAG: hypothetical protein JST00_02510 [Deltaproteobacteria bacterium]|nr:hypothetical protein [Deltaproteobacteria bacterium]
MPKVETHWRYLDGTYVRDDGTTLVRNKHSGGVAWWVHIAGHETPLQIRGQPHLRRFWKNAIAAMRAANAEYPPGGAMPNPRKARPRKMEAAPPSPSKAKAKAGVGRAPRESRSSARAQRRAGGLTARDPFLFLGHGFGTSYKCLECWLWFDRAPGARQQRAIAARLPAPVAVFTRFRGELLHFGSDDALEERVAAAYGEASATRQAWRRFCDDFERAMGAIHRLSPVVAVVKPDDGTHGKRTSPWHRRSVVDAERLVTRAAARAPDALAASLAMNLVEDVLPTWNAARRLDDASRRSWLRWLDALITAKRVDREIASELVDRATWLYATAPAESREALLAAMRPTVQEKIMAKTKLWKR